MSLTFLGPSGSAEQRWIYYALLRDNVIHHLKGGQGDPETSPLLRIGAALGRGAMTVPALELRAEVERARELLALPLTQLAVSGRTRAALTLEWPPPEKVETTLLTDELSAALALPERSERLGDVIGLLIEDLLRITEGAKDGDQVEVRDG
jgi:hypothetical protein